MLEHITTEAENNYVGKMVFCAQAGPRDQPPSLHQVGLTVANLGSSPGAPRAYPPLHPAAGLPTVAVPCEARARSGSGLSASDRCGHGCTHMLHAVLVLKSHHGIAL